VDYTEKYKTTKQQIHANKTDKQVEKALVMSGNRRKTTGNINKKME
jgi:hypothetical protein